MRAVKPKGIVQATSLRSRPVGARVLIYGPVGCGKTTQLLTLLEEGPMLVLDVDGSPDRMPSAEGLEVLPIPPGKVGLDLVEQTYGWLRTGDHGFKSVGLDTLTVLGSNALSYVLEGNPTKSKRDDEERRFLPDRTDYGAANRWILAQVAAYRTLALLQGINVVFTAHVKAEEDERTGRESVRPALSGMVGKEAPGLVKLVGYLDEANGERTIRFGKTKYISAKYRFPMDEEPRLKPVEKLRKVGDPASAGETLASLLRRVRGET